MFFSIIQKRALLILFVLELPRHTRTHADTPAHRYEKAQMPNNYIDLKAFHNLHSPTQLRWSLLSAACDGSARTNHHRVPWSTYACRLARHRLLSVADWHPGQSATSNSIRNHRISSVCVCDSRTERIQSVDADSLIHIRVCASSTH